jgi:hypothetical protein
MDHYISWKTAYFWPIRFIKIDNQQLRYLQHNKCPEKYSSCSSICERQISVDVPSIAPTAHSSLVHGHRSSLYSFIVGHCIKRYNALFRIGIQLYFSGHRHFHAIHTQVIIDNAGYICYAEARFLGHQNDAKQFTMMQQIGGFRFICCVVNSVTVGCRFG